MKNRIKNIFSFGVVRVVLVVLGSAMMAACDGGGDSSLSVTGGQYRLDRVNVLIGTAALAGFADGEAIELNGDSVTIGGKIYGRTTDPQLQATFAEAAAEVSDFDDNYTGYQIFIYGESVESEYIVFAYAFEIGITGGQIRYSKNGGQEVATATFELSN